MPTTFDWYTIAKERYPIGGMSLDQLDRIFSYSWITEVQYDEILLMK
ncbi:hypothetical protein HNQ80_003612 [Anaerosolibacter carboniphilus]|uniref:Uncharacterized protein n=1 Tax=Anaerosolibacter carboniphilus TaxID=1417629 RepID=A0A841KVN2_9FIRM|nr:hypothetical protein [Anaerosolibacter carboniphilus]MBB6217491.1 hypothetical protein [Anaerosolibacter carboniphilus]